MWPLWIHYLSLCPLLLHTTSSSNPRVVNNAVGQHFQCGDVLMLWGEDDNGKNDSILHHFLVPKIIQATQTGRITRLKQGKIQGPHQQQKADC